MHLLTRLVDWALLRSETTQIAAFLPRKRVAEARYRRAAGVQQAAQNENDLDAPIREAHVIAVDATLTPDEAWAELCANGMRTTNTGGTDTWAVIQCDGVECAGIVFIPD